MEQLLEYRQHLLGRYEEAACEFCEAVETTDSPKVPREADGWNVHQIAAHTRDVERMIYGLRVRSALEEENPLFENFDGDAWMAEHYNADEPLASILDELADSVRTNVAQLKRLRPKPGRAPAVMRRMETASPSKPGWSAVWRISKNI